LYNIGIKVTEDEGVRDVEASDRFSPEEECLLVLDIM
jgi:hypothetical protein